MTPPKENSVVDDYFSLGASRVACNIEVWDDDLEKTITPGKYEFTTKKRQISVLSYIAEKYGKGKAFSNFIIGLEPFESLKKGATYLAQRGIIPGASVWMPFGKPVMWDLSELKAPAEVTAMTITDNKVASMTYKSTDGVTVYYKAGSGWSNTAFN